MRPRFSSLRQRLTLAFAAIILVTLLLAGVALVFILRDYQFRRETLRVAELTVPLSTQVRSLEQLGASPREIVEFLERQADELDLRIVLADPRGLVYSDSEQTLVGRRIDLQSQQQRLGPGRRARLASVEGPDGEVSLLLAPVVNRPDAAGAPPPPGAPLPERLLGRQSNYLVGLGIPRQTLAGAWLELLPRLALAAVGALLLSAAIAYLLAASIARPLAAMTHAAEAMARGNYEHQLAVSGDDEVGRLGRAFNIMAREVSASQRTLRDFLANVSHDLRTPLTSIQGFSQALVDGTLARPDEVAEAGRIVNQEATRMSRLVDDLLFLSKLERGQLPLVPARLDLAELLTERVAAQAPRAAEQRLALHFMPASAPPVRADPAHLARVIDNLLDNALRHAPPDTVVTLRLSSTDQVSAQADSASTNRPTRGQAAAPPPRGPAQPYAAVLLAVHNQGPAIPSSDLGRVFERFYQVDRARTAGGSGLGLAICREIVQSLGGAIWAESDPERGTTFLVQLAAAGPTDQSGQPARSGGSDSTSAVVLEVGSAVQHQG